MNKILIGREDNELIFVDEHTNFPNQNTFIAAGPGSGKTTAFVIPNVIFNTEASMIVTDTKGTVYEKTSNIKRKQGYEVYVANFDNMAVSSSWNPMDYVKTEQEIATLAYVIVANKNDPEKKDIWFTGQVSFLQALMLYFVKEKPFCERNLPSILDFLQNTDMTEDEDTGLSDMDIIFKSLPIKHPARRIFELGFGKSKSKTRMGIVTSLVSTLTDFIPEDVEHFISSSDFLFSEIAERKIIVYVIIPALDKSWEGLINLYITQICTELYKVGRKNHAKLPRPVFMICDEFTNCGKFEIMESFAATSREYGIILAFIVQNLTQLYDKYGKDKAESLIGNCAIQICMGNVNNTTAKYFSDTLNNATVKVDTGGTSKSAGGKESRSISTSYSYIAMSLMSTDDINNMDKEKEICIFRNRHPLNPDKAYYFELIGDYLDEFECNQTEYISCKSQKAKDLYKGGI